MLQLEKAMTPGAEFRGKKRALMDRIASGNTHTEDSRAFGGSLVNDEEADYINDGDREGSVNEDAGPEEPVKPKKGANDTHQ